MTPFFSRVYCVDTGFHTGEENMEFDRKLMEAFVDGRFQRRFGRESCLWRFYAWHPYSITLGYNQDQSHIDTLICQQAGIDVVRRPTGGRAVFHADEFTYSFFADAPEHNTILYRLVHEVIRHALEGLGIYAEFCRSTLSMPLKDTSAHAISCFMASARYELQVEGRKLVGSAQRRTGNVLLQHGSLPFSERHRELYRFIAFSEEGSFKSIKGEMEKKTISLKEILGYIPQYDCIADLVFKSAGVPHGVQAVMLQPEDLSDIFESNEYSIH